jgi:hypothetical protein
MTSDRGVLAQASTPYYNQYSKDYGANHGYRSNADQQGSDDNPRTHPRQFGEKTGDRMSFTLMPDGVVLMRVKNKRVSELAGLWYMKGGKPVAVELLSR